MSLNHEPVDADFECNSCNDTFSFKQLNVKEREDILSYSCPVCESEIYQTQLNRTNK